MKKNQVNQTSFYQKLRILALDNKNTRKLYQMLLTSHHLHCHLLQKKTQERCKRNSYTHYSGETRVKIAKYAENGNTKAVKHFEKEFPNLKESTVRNFKKNYYEKLCKARREGKTEVLSLSSKVRGRPPILMEVDGKLIRFLKGIRRRGGVINIHVVRAVTQALIDCNISLTHLANFDMPRSWVHSIYKRMGYKARAGTTSRPPVPFSIF